MESDKHMQRGDTLRIVVGTLLIFLVLVGGASAAADLTVTSVSYSPSSATPGQSISVTFTIENQGTSASGSFYNQISLGTSTYGTTYSLGDFSMSSLAPGEVRSATITSNSIPPSVPAGSHYVTVFTDNRKGLTESDENNNIGSSNPNKLTVLKSDLTVTSVSYSPSSATPGQSISVTFTIENQGTSASGSFYNQISLGTSKYGTTYSLGDFSMSSLAPGKVRSVTITCDSIPSSVPAGSYYVTVFTDNRQGLIESDENNNIGSSDPNELTVIPANPDLTVSSTVSFSPSSITTGQSISVTFTIENRGTSASGSFYNRISLATSTYGTTYSLGDFSMSSLAPAEVRSTTITSDSIPSSVPAGDYYVTVYTDGNEALTESREDNNIGSSDPNKLTVSPATVTPANPDLTVSSMVSFSPSSVTTGQNISVTFAIENQGSSPSGRFNNRISLETSTGTIYSLGDFSMSSLAPGEVRSTTVTSDSIPSSVPAGDYYVTVYTDGNEALTESREDNNIGSSDMLLNLNSPPKSMAFIDVFEFFNSKRWRKISATNGNVLLQPKNIKIATAVDDLSGLGYTIHTMTLGEIPPEIRGNLTIYSSGTYLVKEIKVKSWARNIPKTPSLVSLFWDKMDFMASVLKGKVVSAIAKLFAKAIGMTIAESIGGEQGVKAFVLEFDIGSSFQECTDAASCSLVAASMIGKKAGNYFDKKIKAAWRFDKYPVPMSQDLKIITLDVDARYKKFENGRYIVVHDNGTRWYYKNLSTGKYTPYIDTDEHKVEAVIRTEMYSDSTTLKTDLLNRGHGVLRIKLPKNTLNGGEINSKGNYKYNTYRAWIKVAKASKVVTTFALTNKDMTSSYDNIYFTIYNNRSVDLSTGTGKTMFINSARQILSFDPSADFHEYRIDYYQDLVSFYVDGNQLQTWRSGLPTGDMIIKISSSPISTAKNSTKDKYTVIGGVSTIV